MPGLRSTTGALLIFSGGVALALGWLCVNINLARACAIADTPYLQLCPSNAPGSPAHLAGLRSRIDANPGDANAYVQLALAEPSPAWPRLADAAARLAPNDPRVLVLQAAAALDRQDWSNAVQSLIRLTENYENPQASLVLARLIAAGQGRLLSAYLTQGNRWLGRALAQLPQLKAPLSTALPLIAQAATSGLLDASEVRSYLRQLKAAGAWVDAYSLWLSLHARPLPMLYNADFDQAFDPDGFDWEVDSTTPPRLAGAIVERRSRDKRGAVLDIRFTGRALAVPLVRQYLLLGAGRYRLRGDYMAYQFRMEHGLVWSVRCIAGPSVQAGRSSTLENTGGAWRSFEFEFSVAPDCGMVASLQLEPYAIFEATLGASGNMAFDALSLKKLGS